MLGPRFFGQKSKEDSISYLQAFKEFLLTDIDMRDIDAFIKNKKLVDLVSGTTKELRDKIIDAGRLCTNVAAATI